MEEIERILFRVVHEVPRVCLPRDRKFLLRKFTCPAPNVPAKRPQVATSQVRLFKFSSQLPLSPSTLSHLGGAVPCSCEPGFAILDHTSLLGNGRACGTVIAWSLRSLLSWARSCHWCHCWERTPLYHGYCWVAQVPAHLSSLLPPGATLINKTIVLLFITVLRSLCFLIPHTKK